MTAPTETADFPRLRSPYQPVLSLYITSTTEETHQMPSMYLIFLLVTYRSNVFVTYYQMRGREQDLQ